MMCPDYKRLLAINISIKQIKNNISNLKSSFSKSMINKFEFTSQIDFYSRMLYQAELEREYIVKRFSNKGVIVDVKA